MKKQMLHRVRLLCVCYGKKLNKSTYDVLSNCFLKYINLCVLHVFSFLKRMSYKTLNCGYLWGEGLQWWSAGKGSFFLLLPFIYGLLFIYGLFNNLFIYGQSCYYLNISRLPWQRNYPSFSVPFSKQSMYVILKINLMDYIF